MGDLYKLDQFEYYFKISQGRINTPAKANKGSFYKATEPKTGKTIYFLGTMHSLPYNFPIRAQHVVDHVTAKVNEQLKLDGREKIGTLWMEDENVFVSGCLDCKYAKTIGAEQRKALETTEYRSEMCEILDTAYAKEFKQWSLEKKKAQEDWEENARKELAKNFIRGNIYGMLVLYIEAIFFSDCNRKLSGDGYVGMQWRNRNWVEQLLAENENVQIVIAGAAHAWFKTGILGLLQAEGWNIEQIDLNLPYPTEFEDIYKKTASLIDRISQ